MRKSLFSILLLAVIVPFQLPAQSPKEWIAENPQRSGGCMHAYEPLDTAFTAAPEGFYPFYISHFGRHGSRFAGSENDYKVVTELQKLSDEGKLTEKGQQLLSDLKTLKEYSDGRYGKLTELGASEHRAIARRMYSHYPEVFNNPDRTRVTAASTASGRVIESKENFLSVISNLSPLLSVSSYTLEDVPEHADAKLATTGFSIPKEVKAVSRIPGTGSARKEILGGFSSERLKKEWFRNPEKDSIPASIFQKVQSCGRHYECLGNACLPNVMEKYFTPEELYYLWAGENFVWFSHSCMAEGSDFQRMRYYGGGILNDIIAKADEAVKGNDVAADLRFSHDTYLYPLLSMMAVEGADYEGPVSGATLNNVDFRNVCTAGNVQLIFYSNGKDILVKILKNEKEVRIPALKTFTGIYYEWSALRDHFASRIEKYHTFE